MEKKDKILFEADRLKDEYTKLMETKSERQEQIRQYYALQIIKLIKYVMEEYNDEKRFDSAKKFMDYDFDDVKSMRFDQNTLGVVINTDFINSSFTGVMLALDNYVTIQLCGVPVGVKEIFDTDLKKFLTNYGIHVQFVCTKDRNDYCNYCDMLCDSSCLNNLETTDLKMILNYKPKK